jgi:hypothetical protein
VIGRSQLPLLPNTYKTDFQLAERFVAAVPARERLEIDRSLGLARDLCSLHKKESEEAPSLEKLGNMFKLKLLFQKWNNIKVNK